MHLKNHCRLYSMMLPPLLAPLRCMSNTCLREFCWCIFHFLAENFSQRWARHRPLWHLRWRVGPSAGAHQRLLQWSWRSQICPQGESSKFHFFMSILHVAENGSMLVIQVLRILIPNTLFSPIRPFLLTLSLERWTLCGAAPMASSSGLTTLSLGRAALETTGQRWKFNWEIFVRLH